MPRTGILDNKLAGKKIGWVIPRVLPYSMVMASTRLRAYDVIKHLRQNKVKAGLYNPFLRYDLVIFQKAFKSKFLALAEKLKFAKTKIVFDINVNYIDSDTIFVTDQQKRDIKEMLDLADLVITPSSYLRELYARYNEKTFLIEEIIEDRFFKLKKEHMDKKDVALLFCGYAVKCDELYLIKDVLKYLYERYKVRLLLISDKDPRLDLIPYKFFKYNHKMLPELLLQGDIKISPRDLSRKYNLGHTFTRIGYPMALGLPVVASPLSSYRNSPALLCNTAQEWKAALERLVCQWRLRRELGQTGREFVRANFSQGRIIRKYTELFSEAVS